MKLQINKSLRAALLSSYAVAASFTTSLPIVTMTAGFVTYTLISEQAEAGIVVTPTGGTPGGIGPKTGTFDDYVITDFTYGWFGGGNFGWTAPTIYIANWKQTAGSESEHVVVNGDLKDGSHYKIMTDTDGDGVADTNTSPYGDGDIEVSVEKLFDHNHVFNGAHGDFSGDFIMSTPTGFNGKDFVFTNRVQLDPDGVIEADEYENISGTGAIEFGIRTAVEGGLAANTVARDAIYFYTGDVSIGNSAINANALSLNGLNAGNNTSDGYKTSRTANTGTDGATYTISSALNINTLEINDGSTAILVGNEEGRVTSTVNQVSFAAGGSLQVGDGSTLLLGGTHSFSSDTLSITDGGELTINGRLNLTSSIDIAGTLNFGSSAILDISALTAELSEGSYVYDIANITGTGSVDIANLAWDRILGVNGLSADSSISYDAGKLTLSGILASLAFTGSDSPSAPASLDWQTADAFNGSSFSDGSSVIFDQHTSSSLSADTIVGAITVSDNSSLSINTAGNSLRMNGLELGNNSQFRVGVADLDLSVGAISATGVAGSTLRLDGYDGANYNLANVLDLTDYAGEVSLNNATITLANASDLGSTYVLTLGENATLSSAGVTMAQRLHIGGDAAITNTSGTTTTALVTGAAGHTLTLDGAVRLHGNVEFEGDIIVNTGTTTFGTGQYSTETLSAASFTVKSGALLQITHGSADFTGTDITLENSRLHSTDLDAGANGIQLGTLTLSGNTTISHAYNGAFTFNNMTGSGTLTFNANAATNENGYLKINSVTNYNGTLTFGTGDAADKIIMMGAISQNADSHMVLNGRVADAENATFSGEGSVSFNAGMRLNGAANTLESGTLNISSIEFANTTSSLAALGGRLNLNGASFDAATNGTLKLGAATVSSSEASVTFADKIELGAHATGGTAGTAETPIVTTIDTMQTDSADGVALNITGDISDASGSVGSLNVIGSGSLTLSGNNSFSSGLNVTQSTIILGSATAAGRGAITVNGGSLNVGAQAITNAVTYEGGSLSGMSNFAGSLQVKSNLTLTDGISGDVTVSSDATLDLSGLWNFDSAITNAGTVNLGSDMTLNIAGLAFTDDGSGTYSLTLIEGGSIDATNWLTGGVLDITKIQGTLAGRDYSYANGVLSYILSGKSLTWHGGLLQLAVGTDFNEGGVFANNDSITFASGTENSLVVDADVSSATVVLGESASITTFGTDYVLSIGELTLEAGASLHAGSNVVASLVTMEDASFLQVSSLSPIESATLNGSAHLSVLNAQAAGLVSIDKISGGETASLSLYLSAEGSSLQMDNFTGNLNVAGGQMLSSLADINDFASVTLAAGTSYEITDTLGSVNSYDLTHLKGDANSTLTISGTGIVVLGAGDKTRIELSNDFKGAVELLSGTLSGEYSVWGGSSKIILHDGTGLVGDPVVGATVTLSQAVDIVSGATAYTRVWGSGCVLELSGALTGDSTTTIKQTDGGTLRLTGDLSQYAGTLSVEGFKISIDADATSLNKVLFTGDHTLEIGTNRTVTTQGVSGEYTFYERTTNHGYNIVIGEGSTFTDNVYMRLGTGTVDITGDGTYIIDGYMGGDGANNRASVLNIGENTTLVVTGTTESGDASTLPAFMLGHYSGATSTITVDGTLDIASGLSNRDGSGTITVNEGGKLTLREGLYAVDNGNSAGAVTINVNSDATLELGNQASATAAGVLVADVAADATIKAIGTGETTMRNNISLSGTGSVTLTADSATTTVNVNASLTQKAGSTTGLAITGTDSQTFNLNAANSYAGDTTITGATVVAGNALAFGAGDVTVNSGTLDLNAQSIANDITLNAGTIENVHTLTGALAMEGGSVTLSEQMAGTADITINGGTFTLEAGLDAAVGAGLLGERSVTVNGVEGKIGVFDMSNYNVANTITINGIGSVINDGRSSGSDTIISDGSTGILGEATNSNIIMEGTGSTAELREGFSQGAGSVISGSGVVELAAGSEITLSNANTYSGGTKLTAGTEADVTGLTVQSADAIGTGDVVLADHTRLSIAAGVAMTNGLKHENGNTELLSGDLTVMGRATGTSYGSASTATSFVENVSLTNADVELAANGHGTIRNTTLTNTDVHLLEDSILTMENVHIGANSRVYNTDATAILRNSAISAVSGTSLTHLGVQNLETTEKPGEDMPMQVFSLTNIDVANLQLEGSLTLNIDMNTADYSAFDTAYTMGGMIGFELDNVDNADALAKLWYGNVTINISENGTSRYNLTALGHTLSEGKSLVFYVPEPSTATLSLLALTALLARRRRKNEQ